MKKANRKQVWLCMLLIITICAALAGCQSPQPAPSSAPSVVVDEVTSDIQIEVPENESNPLTGLYDLEEGEASMRPVAVMINNINKAWPQAGIGSADILYEVEVEGGITRLMAVFANSGRLPEKLGSVRSMRPYYINLAAGHDAIYVGHGWSPTTQKLLKQKHIIDYINPNGAKSHGDAFYRDADKAKTKGREHSSYTTREKLQEVVSSLKLRTELEADRVGQSFMSFNPPDEPKAVGKDCLSLYVPFSNYAKSNFTYDAQKKLYLKEEFSDKHIDEATGEQLAFTNVLVLFMPSGKEDSKRLTFDFSSPGAGYYASMGKIQEIQWEKGKEYKNPFVFKDANGQPLNANAGKTMVCIVRSTRSGDITFS